MAATEEFNAANAYCQNLRADIEEDVNPEPRAKGALPGRRGGDAEARAVERGRQDVVVAFSPGGAARASRAPAAGVTALNPGAPRARRPDAFRPALRARSAPSGVEQDHERRPGGDQSQHGIRVQGAPPAASPWRCEGDVTIFAPDGTERTRR